MATNISIEKKQAVDTVKGDATIMVSCAITARKVHKDDAGTRGSERLGSLTTAF